MPSPRDVLQLLHDMGGRLDGDVSLESLARRSGWSPFHLHRAFRRIVGETPKQYTLRLRLEGAAARLLARDDTVLDVALAAGFTSQEVFTRAFHRHFGRTPGDYRRTMRVGASRQARERHLALTTSTGPCVGLYHVSISPPSSPRSSSMPTLSIEQRDLAPRSALVIRRRIPRSELQATMAECFGRVFGYCQAAGLPLDGRPFTRYLSIGPGLWTIECGKPVALSAPGHEDIEAVTLPGGPTAIAVHGGLYDQLPETYVALEQWILSRGLAAGQAPWECYITSPAEHPDPAEWRTEVYWPLATVS